MQGSMLLGAGVPAAALTIYQNTPSAKLLTVSS